MRAVMLMFDSLNRRMLAPYGGTGVRTPNFARLVERSVTFENAYIGSMPCMPARRELHTGRHNFLHRSWGPLEPFDLSAPELLKRAGVHTHLVTDHYHYWEDGGATYHTRYSTWEAIRGQEGDPWRADLRVTVPASRNNEMGRDAQWTRCDWMNRAQQQGEADYPQVRTVNAGLDFLERNHGCDNWFLQIENFDPHEPYDVPERFRQMYEDAYNGPHWDWPPSGRAGLNETEARHFRALSAALHTMCDESLGRVLDAFDRYNLWDDTLLIVNTDHGFLLGEHENWAKCSQPFYNEIAHIPLFIWDPRCGARGERRESLVQTIDLPATLLEFFGQPRPASMQGVPLRTTIAEDTPVREAGLFGICGGHVNLISGRYLYMRGPEGNPENVPLYNYTLMPAHMRHVFGVEELQTLELAEPFSFTQGCRTLRIPWKTWVNPHSFGTLLFDLENDSAQNRPFRDEKIEAGLIEQLRALMQATDAPREQYTRLGIAAPKT